MATKPGAGSERRDALRAELDSLRGQQSNSKTTRSKALEQLKATQDSIQKKVRISFELLSSCPYRSSGRSKIFKHPEPRYASGRLLTLMLTLSKWYVMVICCCASFI